MIKYSKQREEILETLKNSYTHLSAEEIYLKVKQNGSTASKGTVYRNLKLLSDNGSIVKISIPNFSDQYDYIHENHHHAICKECGKVFDFTCKVNMDSIKKAILEQTDLDNISDLISVQGVCKSCQNKKEEKK